MMRNPARGWSGRQPWGRARGRSPRWRNGVWRRGVAEVGAEPMMASSGGVIGVLLAVSLFVIGSITGAPHIDEASEVERLRPVRGTQVDRGGEMACGPGSECWAKCARAKGRATRRVGMPVRGVGFEREHAGLNRQGGARAERVALSRGWLTRSVFPDGAAQAGRQGRPNEGVGRTCGRAGWTGWTAT